MISKPGLYLLFSSDRCTVVPTLFDAHCLKTSSSASFSFASPVNHQHFNKERVVVLCSNHLCTYSENGKKKICTTVPILFPEESIGFHFSRLSQRQKNQQVITSFLSVKRVAQCKKASLSVNTGFLLHPSVFFFYIPLPGLTKSLRLSVNATFMIASPKCHCIWARSQGPSECSVCTKYFALARQDLQKQLETGLSNLVFEKQALGK